MKLQLIAAWAEELWWVGNDKSLYDTEIMKKIEESEEANWKIGADV